MTLGTSYLTGRTLAGNMTKPGESVSARRDEMTPIDARLAYALDVFEIDDVGDDPHMLRREARRP